MKVVAVVAVITLCLVHGSHSFDSSQAKLTRCKTNPSKTTYKTQLDTVRRLLKQYQKDLMKSNQSSTSYPRLNNSCNIIKATKLKNATKLLQTYKRSYIGIQIFLNTAEQFSKLTAKSTSEELVQKEKKIHGELKNLVNLTKTELLECFNQFKTYNGIEKFDKLIKKTEARALKFSNRCFQISDITHQKNYNIVYHKHLNTFLRISNNILKKIFRECKKKRNYQRKT